MRLNDRELMDISSTTPTFEGRLNYRPPSGNFGQSGFKERWFRLRCNLLFYFRINEAGKVDVKPSGVFVLENSYVQLEQRSSIPFAFSITFRDEPEKKHIFSARSDSNVKDWIASIKHCTYEYLRTQRILLQKQITLKTGKDPLLMYPYNEGAIRDWVADPSDVSVPPPRPPPPKVMSSQTTSRSSAPQQIFFQSHLKALVPERSAPKEGISPTQLDKISIPQQVSFQSHVKPLVPQRSTPKERISLTQQDKTSIPQQVSLQSHIRPMVPQHSTPTVPLPISQVQSSNANSSEMNLIEF